MTAGGGVTYPRVVELLKSEVAKKGQRAAARDVKIALLSLQRYIKGIGEPSQATLEKLADYFKVPPAWLRGDYPGDIDYARRVFEWNLLSEDEKQQRKADEEEAVNAWIDEIRVDYPGIDDEVARLRKLESLLPKYKELWASFARIPPEDRREAIELLAIGINYMSEPSK